MITTPSPSPEPVSECDARAQACLKPLEGLTYHEARQALERALYLIQSRAVVVPNLEHKAACANRSMPAQGCFCQQATTATEWH